MTPIRSLINKVRENISHHELFERGAKIIVSVSGGPDSVCLLDILSRLKKYYALQIIIAHVNYGLRGKDSERDEIFVRNLAKTYSFPIDILRSKISGKTPNLEEKLRNIRYAFFEKLRKNYSAGKIAVAHNLNDQAETALLRVLRGTGLRGMGAIKFRSGYVIRPLLDLERKDILAYLKENRIRYRIDRTNLKNDFTRNKVRNELLPYLEKKFNPKIQNSLFRLCLSAGDDYNFIEQYAAKWLGNREVVVSKLLSLHPSLLHEVLRQMIGRFRPALREMETSHIREIIKMLRSNKNKRQEIILKGLKIEKKGDRLLISQMNRRRASHSKK